jgi:phosphoketolase
MMDVFPEPDILSPLTAAPGPLSPELLHRMDAYWRAANYLSVGHFYLYDNPLLKRPLALSDVLDDAIAGIRRVQDSARTTGAVTRPRWPMIVLKSSRGWTDPRIVDGLQVDMPEIRDWTWAPPGQPAARPPDHSPPSPSRPAAPPVSPTDDPHS